jgi:hypothetical protein
MLDSSHREQEIAAWIYTLPCQVNLPAKLRENFAKSGPAPATPEDARGGVRIFCRGENHRAALQTCQNLPAFPRETEWTAVYTTNISKKGCGLLHNQIVYPGERFALVLLTGVPRTIEVAWCRRVDKNCFQVGSRFVESDSTPVAIP